MRSRASAIHGSVPAVSLWFLPLVLTAVAVAAPKLDKASERWLREVHLLILPEEEAIYRALPSSDERREFEQIFWARRDPDPSTPTNELEDAVKKARGRADDLYTIPGGEPGHLTGCGQVLTLLGEPLEREGRETSARFDAAQTMREGALGPETWTYQSREGDPVEFTGGELRISFDDACRFAEGGRVLDDLRRVARSYVVRPQLDYEKGTDGHLVPLQALLAGTLGIALTAGAAAAVNCLVEQRIDALMTRTRARPLPRGQVTSLQTLVFAGIVGGAGLTILYQWANALTMWLTLATFIGYAIIYTVVLKPMTPQNIVIGGAFGAMPPVLGWTAVTGEIAADALLLFLIIFAWTPPHFWALALYRKHEYAKAGVPMLPVTHGDKYTRLHVLLYTVILVVVSMLPFVTRMSGILYLASALILGVVFLWYAARVHFAYTDHVAHSTFRYSIAYLSALFAALLVDHYWRIG